jgi:hypothetical protein
MDQIEDVHNSIDMEEAFKLVTGDDNSKPKSQKSVRGKSQKSEKPKSEKSNKEESKRDDTLTPLNEDGNTEDNASPKSSKASKESLFI